MRNLDKPFKYWFRAKTLDSNRWIEGYYVRHETRMLQPLGDDKLADDEVEHFIVRDDSTDWGLPRELISFKINPKTLGQYTGLIDRNGKRVFEGDIVDIVIFSNGHRRRDRGVIKFNTWRATFSIYSNLPEKAFSNTDVGEYINPMGHLLKSLGEELGVVIGNRYDNPELCKDWFKVLDDEDK